MRDRIRNMLPHAVILICNMYVVFFLIDRVNPAMNFIDNGLTKGLLALLCAGAAIDALALMRIGRRTRRRAAGKRPRPVSRDANKPAGSNAARAAYSRSAASPANRAVRPVEAKKGGDRR